MAAILPRGDELMLQWCMPQGRSCSLAHITDLTAPPHQDGSLLPLHSWTTDQEHYSDGTYGILKHWLLDCLFNSLLRLATKNTSIFCITGPLWRESTSNHWFPSQSNCCAESVSKSWYRKLGPFYPYPSGMLQRHWENCKIAQVPVKQPWRIWMNNSYEFTKKLYQWLSARLQYLHCKCTGDTAVLH